MIYLLFNDGTIRAEAEPLHSPMREYYLAQDKRHEMSFLFKESYIYDVTFIQGIKFKFSHKEGPNYIYREVIEKTKTSLEKEIEALGSMGVNCVF